MAHQDVPNTVRVMVTYTSGGNNAANVWHVKCDIAPTQDLLGDIRSVFAAWLQTNWHDVASSGWTSQEITLTDLSSINGARQTSPAAYSGVNTAEPMPANVTVAVKADIGTRGRGKNGRTFFVGLPEDIVSGNLLTQSGATAVEAAMEDLRVAVEQIPDVTGLCIPHFVVGGVRPPVVDTSIVRQYVLANNYIDSQKDRLPFHKKRKRRTTP